MQIIKNVKMNLVNYKNKNIYNKNQQKDSENWNDPCATKKGLASHNECLRNDMVHLARVVFPKILQKHSEII